MAFRFLTQWLIAFSISQAALLLSNGPHFAVYTAMADRDRMLPRNLVVLAMAAWMASLMKIGLALTAFTYRRRDIQRETSLEDRRVRNSWAAWWEWARQRGCLLPLQNFPVKLLNTLGI